MSSHHIVREKQEPALIIANGEACSTELLNQLLEWSPFVVVLDGAYERVQNLGIKIDVILGDFDRIDFQKEYLGKIQFPIEVIHTPDQDKTDLEKAIDFLIERGFPAANIVWATGRRADHTFANISILPKYLKTISLIPISRVSHLSTSNLKFELKNEELILGIRNGNSNEALFDGIVEISYRSGDLLIMECSD
jgi:thiamine pyrophosphokinase